MRHRTPLTRTAVSTLACLVAALVLAPQAGAFSFADDFETGGFGAWSSAPGGLTVEPSPVGRPGRFVAQAPTGSAR